MRLPELFSRMYVKAAGLQEQHLSYACLAVASNLSGRSRKMNITKCSEVMTTKLQCCLPTTTVDQVAQMMRVNSIGAVPIVESLETRKLLGVVTDRDLALRVVGQGCDPKLTQVSEVMSRQLITCRVNDSIEAAVEKMEEFRVRRIPIVDESFEIVGIVSASDVAANVREYGTVAQLFRAISRARVRAY